MYAVIMGGGSVGLCLAEFLINDGFDITLIENSENLCNLEATELDAIVICGNGTDTKILEEANIEEADFFIASTGNDEVNLLSCVLVKSYGVPKIISRVSNPDHEEAFIKVGIDNVINPETTAAGFLQKIITHPNVADLTAFGKGDAEIIDMVIESKKVAGKKVSEISPTDDYIIIATYPEGNLTIPKPETVLNKGSKISILVKRDSFKKVAKMFMG
ncbi:MAG: TrkA family potassium uptake protein [Methanobrevibacter sp.]|nr:TrkA family potassium uptake protein [Methanobrevibacter sp.]